MFRYGIKALEVKQGYKSYLAIKQLCKLSINEVKDGVSNGDVLNIWECNERDLAKLKIWQAKMQAEMRSLANAGVTYESYYFDDEHGWQPITNLEQLLQRDAAELQHQLERAEQAKQALTLYRQGSDRAPQALDQLIGLMSDDMRKSLYDTGASAAFNTRLNRLLPVLDAAETRMLAYELDSHVRKQALQLNASTPNDTHATDLNTNPYLTPVATPEPAPPVPSATPVAAQPVYNASTAIAPQTSDLTSTSTTTVMDDDMYRVPWWLLLVAILLLAGVWWLG